MSRWNSAEEFFIAREAFAEWCETDVNPQRAAAGLKPVTRADALLFFDRVDRFMQKWSDDRAANQPGGAQT